MTLGSYSVTPISLSIVCITCASFGVLFAGTAMFDVLVSLSVNGYDQLPARLNRLQFCVFRRNFVNLRAVTGCLFFPVLCIRFSQIYLFSS